MVQKWVAGLIGIFIALLIGVSLVGPFQSEVTTASANVTGSAGTLISFLPLLFVVILILSAVGGFALSKVKF